MTECNFDTRVNKHGDVVLMQDTSESNKVKNKKVYNVIDDLIKRISELETFIESHGLEVPK